VVYFLCFLPFRWE